MFLRAKRRFKDGKEHRYRSIVENRRTAGGRVVQRQVLYVGEINDSRQAAWCKSTRWLNVLKLLVCQRLLAPGSEWRSHRPWFERTALSDLPGEDCAMAQKDTLYRCLDRILDHKPAFFSCLTERWRTLFDARFDVLYDLTSTYFECARVKGSGNSATAGTSAPIASRS